MLRRRRRTLLRLARVLRRGSALTRKDCVRIVRGAGTRVRVDPVCNPTLPSGELDACNLVRNETDERIGRVLAAQGLDGGAMMTPHPSP